MEDIRRTDIKIIVGRGSVARRARSESALIREILRHKDHERAYAQLKLTLCAFERAYRRDKNVGLRVGPFLQRLAKACVEQNRVDLFMRAWDGACMDPDESASVDELYVYGALNRFAIEAQRAYGDNGQIAAEFALALLELVNQGMIALREESRVDPQLRFTTVASPDRLRLVREELEPPYRFIVGSFTAPPDGTIFVCKLWLERLFERCAEPSIGMIISSLMAVSRIGSASEARTPVAFIYEPDLKAFANQEYADRAAGVRRYEAEMNALVRSGAKALPPPELLLRERLRRVAEPFFKGRIEQAYRVTELGERMLKAFQGRREEYLSRTKRMTDEIASRPRRGLRPNGLDHVEVTLTPLFNAGIVGLIFHPEGRVFPDVGIELIFRKETPHLHTIRTSVYGLMRDHWGDLYSNERHPEDQELLHDMCCYVVMDVLHRIVTEERPIREHPSRKGSVDASGCVAVRPYMRKLPVGHRVSDTALEAAQRDIGYLPPQGMTFVQAFFRNNELEYDMPSEPFAIYGDEDIELSMKEV